MSFALWTSFVYAQPSKRISLRLGTVTVWLGEDIAEREAQIQRLERLVWDAVYALQKAGPDSEAARLRRSLEKG